MHQHTVCVHPETDRLPREDQLAWKIATVAADPVAVDPDVTEMAINRFIDNVAVAVAAVGTRPVTTARDMALAHPRSGGATVVGCRADLRVHAEWAAWANGAAMRQLDWSDAFGGMTYSHPSDNIAPIVATAQQAAVDGAALIRGIVTGYEIQIALSSGMALHQFGIDQVAHIGPAVPAGIGAALGLPVETIYWAVQQGAYTATLTRQDRKGEITSWKGHAPGHVGKLGIEAVDRCMRGEHAPTPIYEGELGLLAVMLGGKDVRYTVPLPAPGEAKRGILSSFPKQWAAEYEAQPFIDLAFRIRDEIGDLEQVERIVVTGANHMHVVIGTGANDPQKLDPSASRETLDHSLMYIVAVALEDGAWDHVKSYAPERAHRAETIRLWQKISTVEDESWTKRYHDPDPSKRAGGGRMEVALRDGRVVAGEIDNANAHNFGATPWRRDDYLQKFHTLAEDTLDAEEIDRFLKLAQRLPELQARQLGQLYPVLPVGKLPAGPAGLF